MKLYDSIVIGGGPAGSTAAIYLARYDRSVLVIDKRKGRSTYPQLNENYLGFPEGIHARKLRALGHRQARRFGAEIIFGNVLDIKKFNNQFQVRTATKQFQGKSIIIATGVVDILPGIKEIEEYVGKTLFWCITCDGYRTINKKVIVIGQDDEAVTTCLQFLNFTKDLAFLLNCNWDECHITLPKRKALEKHGIPTYEGDLVEIEGSDGFVKTIKTNKGLLIQADYIFNQQGAIPNTDLAKQLGVFLDEKAYILCDEEQRTNIPFVYAAGDVTRIFSHQIVTASHEGATAGQTANYDLYEPFQKEK